MNKILKKVMALSVSTILLTSISGCGSSKNIGGTKKNSNGKIEIEYWYGLGGKLSENMESIISDFNKSQEKYEVKGIAQEDYDATFKSLQAGIAAKKCPAIALLEADKQYTLGSKKLLTDISKYTKEDNDFNEDNYLSALMDCAKQNDKLYGFPIFGTTQLLYYNKKFFEDAGVNEDSLKTWIDISKAAEKLTKKEGNDVSIYGWEPMYGADNLIDAVLSNGGQILSEDGKTAMVNTDEWVEVFESFRKWIHEDKIMRIHSGGQGWQYWYDTIDDVMKDKACGYTGSSGDQGDLDFNKLKAFEQPAFKEGKQAKPIAEGRFLCIPDCVSEEEKQGAYEFIKYFTSPSVNAKWSIASGYIAVNKLSSEDEAFKDFAKDNPQALVPAKQAEHASKAFIDPTGGKILDALKIAADKVEVENISAKDALDEAENTIQGYLEK